MTGRRIFRKKKTVGEYSRYLYDFIVKRQIQEKLKVQELHFKQQGDRAREKEYAQIYGIIMDLLTRWSVSLVKK